MGDHPVRIGHLAFGAAFAAIGLAWLLADTLGQGELAWITAVTALLLGAAGLVTALVRLLR